MTITFATSFITAQNTVTWIGGTPGQETNWDEPRNWSTNHVPNEDSNVVIALSNSSHNAQPIIKNDVEVVSIQILSGGNLTVSEYVKLTVSGAYNYSEGISLHGGNLTNNGTINLVELDVEVTAEYFNKNENTGIVLVNNVAQNTSNIHFASNK